MPYILWKLVIYKCFILFLDLKYLLTQLYLMFSKIFFTQFYNVIFFILMKSIDGTCFCIIIWGVFKTTFMPPCD
jgi:hypothetical protein